ncbi:MAG: DNA translocase FtsK [Bacteroides sp.]|nr:DNA translocase FtsK [Bacteroides sp.]
MAKKNTQKDKEPKPNKPGFFSRAKAVFQNDTLRFITGLLLVIFSVYLLLAFSSFFVTGAADQSIIDRADAAQLVSINNGVKNYAGSRGAQLSSYLINDCFGVASYFIPLFLAMAGIKLMRVRKVNLTRWFIVCALLLMWFSLFFGFAFDDYYADSFLYLGGLHGYNVGCWLASQVGVPGVWLILLASAVCILIYFSARTIYWLRKLFSFSYLKREKKEAEQGEVPEEFTDSWTAEGRPEDATPVTQDDLEEETKEEEVIDFPLDSDASHTPEEPADNPTFEVDNVESEQPAEPAGKSALEEVDPDFTVDEVKEEELETANLEPYNPRLDLEFYKFPTLDLLKSYEDNSPAIDMEEQNANKERIVQVLRSFGIEITSIRASVGPTITLYEITPAEGVRINKIRNLEDDIALNLAAIGIRIIAPIPGRGTIGIEVPNKKPKIVSGQSILGSKKYQETDFELPMVLGKTITNEVYMEDLAKMPHVLVAGATGQGKSVGLNTIIASLLYKKHPSELKFVLIDPKKLEFAPYSILEHHFLAKLPDEEEAVITDVTKVVQTLKSLCQEMDARYDLLKAAGVKNIKEYNAKFRDRKLNPEKGHRFLPYIVVVIDEFGDLIMTAGRDVETPIARIAQLARAAGIHMIIATQRPTTTIITGNIKANFPARIAFRVMQRIDSSTILDRTGANQLVGRGDMLFSKGQDPVRVQCAFIDTPEIEAITQYISHQQGYPTAFMLPEVHDENEGGNDLSDVDMNHLDPLFKEAAELIVANNSGSTSLIQRKFSIGYNRAGRLMDQLEKAGIVGPAQGSKPREVYCVSMDDLDQRLNNLL